jgi:glycogen operon protein
MGRTQQGNNNAWCQDNEISWVDWKLDEEREALQEFTRRLLALRRKHPIFRRTQFLNGRGSPSGLPDAWWFRPDGRRMTNADWQKADAHVLGVFLNGRGLGSVDPYGEPIVDSSFVLLVNAHHEDVVFSLPPRRFGPRWQVELSTAYPHAPATVLTARGSAHVTARSMLLLRQPDPPS